MTAVKLFMGIPVARKVAGDIPVVVVGNKVDAANRVVKVPVDATIWEPALGV